jgi:hypothetical protein
MGGGKWRKKMEQLSREVKTKGGWSNKVAGWEKWKAGKNGEGG